MQRATFAFIILSTILLTGCVSSHEHKNTLKDLSTAREQVASMQDQIDREKSQATEELLTAREALGNTQIELEGAKQALAKEHTTRQAMEAELQRLAQAKEQLRQSLEHESADKAMLAQEKSAKDAEIRRLTQTHRDLTESLKSEIEQGHINIQQVQDRLTINMVDKILFDSGRTDITSQGLHVLKQVSDVLKKVDDKQIRIVGHTDNIPIRGRLREKFPTNWELSTARATTVVRYLIQTGHLEPTTLTAAGHGATKPVASNDTELGRSQNRRIEIVLYPKDLSSLVNSIN